MNTNSGPPSLPTNAALFLDFDGTLVPIAQRPQDVKVPDWVVPALQVLQRHLSGAVAIVSGRPLQQIDAFLAPLALAAAGSHGAERRAADGRVDAPLPKPPAAAEATVRALVDAHEGLIFEPKPSGFGLHFRLRPELEPVCRDTMDSVLDTAPRSSDGESAWKLQHGHCVIELKPGAVSKGTAVRAFLAEAPFAGRLPVFVGDDVTDEDGILAVQSAGGFGVRVGPGSSEAHHRLADIDAVAHWLRRAAASAASTPDRAVQR